MYTSKDVRCVWLSFYFNYTKIQFFFLSVFRDIMSLVFWHLVHIYFGWGCFTQLICWWILLYSIEILFCLVISPFWNLWYRNLNPSICAYTRFTTGIWYWNKIKILENKYGRWGVNECMVDWPIRFKCMVDFWQVILTVFTVIIEYNREQIKTI